MNNTSCTGNCNQGRTCTCNPRMGEVGRVERFLLNHPGKAMAIAAIVAAGWVKLVLHFI